jgi:HSP20 family protein
VPTITRARMDVLDKGEKFEITMDLPGVKKEDINVSIEGARVSVNAEAKLEREVKEGERLLHSERYAASYARSFELPAEVTEEAAEAKFENGVLTLALPKRAPVVSRKLMIK